MTAVIDEAKNESKRGTVENQSPMRRAKYRKHKTKIHRETNRQNIEYTQYQHKRGTYTRKERLTRYA